MTASWRTTDPERFDLPNGLRVFLVENRSVPSIALNLTILTGSRDEPEELAGMAMMASRLLDEGTETRSSLEIADTIESVGGAIDTDCSFDRCAVYLGVLAGDAALGLELVADIVCHPTFSEDSVSNECDRTLAEIQSAMDRPQVVANWEFNELVYGRHPLHRPVHGYPNTLQRIRREHLQAFHQQHIIPNNAILSVVGDFESLRMRALIERVFGSWKARSHERVAVPSPEPVSGVKTRFLSLPGQQAHIYMGHLGISRTHPDYYALQVMDTILGGGAGLTARIPQKLRDEMGLAYTTYATMTSSAGLEPGRFVAYIGTSPEHVDAAIAGFVSEIDRIRSEPVLAEELRDAQAYLTGSFVFGFETNAQIARFLVNAELFGLGFDYIEKYPDVIEAVNAEAVRRVASTYLSTENYVLVVAGPEEARTNRLKPDGG